MIDSDDHEGIDAVLAKRQPSRAGAAWILALALVACGGFVLCWAYILLITGQSDLP